MNYALGVHTSEDTATSRTDLTASSGTTTILVDIDHFSKGCKFIHPKGVSTTDFDTAEASFHHVFQTH